MIQCSKDPAISDREPGVSIWLPSYWISQPGVEEAKLILSTAWPHKHPSFLNVSKVKPEKPEKKRETQNEIFAKKYFCHQLRK